MALEQMISDKILGLAISDKKSVTNIDIEKLVTPPGGHILKQSNNLNNIGRCPTDHLCPILLKSGQKFLTRFKSVSFWLTRQPDFYIKLTSLKKFER